MAYTGYFSKELFRGIFYAAWRGQNLWAGMDLLYLGTGTAPSFDANGYAQNLGVMSNSYAYYEWASSSNWSWLTSGSGTGYNANAITLTNNQGASRNVANISIYNGDDDAYLGFIKISPAITLAAGDSIVIPVTGLKIGFL